MDAVTLERTLAELRPLVVGRYLSKPRLAGGSALAFDVQGSRDRWLWLDAGRATAGVYWLPRDIARSLAEHSPLAPFPAARARRCCTCASTSTASASSPSPASPGRGRSCSRPGTPA